MYKKAPSFQNESPPQQTLYTKLWDQLTTFLFSSCAIPPGTQASSGWSNASSGDMWYNVGLVLVDDSTPVSHMVSLSRTCQSLYLLFWTRLNHLWEQFYRRDFASDFSPIVLPRNSDERNVLVGKQLHCKEDWEMVKNYQNSLQQFRPGSKVYFFPVTWWKLYDHVFDSLGNINLPELCDTDYMGSISLDMGDSEFLEIDEYVHAVVYPL
eukprot:TRINITY_DN11601_c0_g1_i2.p1 TRINITY_DN11601_c0_g1~~TRINITY_DN11601_c0_g1_i2.p1  ORF type:complete len:210 (+),score=40.73 TRINITY_DN11601_c0_g1_i2:130-759(+)